MVEGSIQRGAIMRKRQVVTTATGRQVTVVPHKKIRVSNLIIEANSITAATAPPLLSDSTRVKDAHR